MGRQLAKQDYFVLMVKNAHSSGLEVLKGRPIG